MRRFFNNLSMKIKFGIALMIPIAGLLFYSGFTVMEKNDTANAMAELRGIVDAAPTIGTYIHDLQAERGTSASYLNSKGSADFMARLDERRRLTNTVQPELDQALTNLLSKDYSVNLTQTLNNVRAQLQDLNNKRSAISSQQMTIEESTAYYSDLIANLINVTSEMPLLSKSGSVTAEITAYIALLQLKEKSGQERNLGSKGFTSGSFDTDTYRNFTSVIREQEAYTWVFLNFATQPLKDAYSNLNNSSTVTRIQEMRTVATAYPKTFDLKGISGIDFFNVASERIELLHELGLTAISTLSENVTQQENAAANTRTIFLVATILLIVASILLGVFVTLGISRSVAQLVTLVTDRDAQVNIDTERRDEIGVLSNSVFTFRNEAVDNIRIKSALDSCQANVMVADVDLNIIYMNETMVAMMKNAESDIKRDLPNLDTNKLIGTNIDTFHKNPAHQRGMLSKLSSVYKTRIEVGGRTFGLIAAPINDEKGNRLGTVVEWDDMTERLALQVESDRIASENMRVKVALDSCTANVMVADNDFNIIYMNEAVMDMMRNGEADIRKELPNFNTSTLIGGSIDRFHKNPAHQRAALEALKSTYSSQIAIGGRSFKLIANPIVNEKGERLGSVVEWSDITQELAIQNEVDSMVNAISEGDFTKSLATDGKVGFMLALADALNALNKNVNNVVNDVANALASLSSGDLTHQINADYKGMYETLKQDVNQTAQRLSQTVSEIIASADEIGSASTEISAGSIDLSQRTEAQASSLEETAASMEEMSTTVKQNADNAQQANQLAINACETAGKGGEIVKQAVIAVTGIEQASQKVSDIIGVIDEIAFQTNLLALNAAVEAARAGEAGKGFAVVAAEVRTLAQRSSEAAKDIKTLIMEANDQVKQGVSLVNNTGDTLAEIVGSSKRVADIIAEIAASSREQASGVEEINTAVTSMDEMTQQNAALVEESSASARSLEEQAEALTKLISFFKIDQGQASAPRKLKEVKATGAPRTAQKKVAVFKSAAPARAAIQDGDDWSEF
ncbi:methyl-accepting chemotaxis protein [Kiloniella laminariae]|uniref:methyl-accepting chemotaxis protein n=1 Tax=Kiloniella laminariae TaxID=454162 RepID=UPI0003667D3E|nr:methyl-accepting chemotaxis protein [Kiloniella laminariae]